MDVLTSVAVGGVTGLRTQGTAAFPAVVAYLGFRIVCADVATEGAVLAKSMQMKIENCIVAHESNKVVV